MHTRDISARLRLNLRCLGCLLRKQISSRNVASIWKRWLIRTDTSVVSWAMHVNQPLILNLEATMAHGASTIGFRLALHGIYVSCSQATMQRKHATKISNRNSIHQKQATSMNTQQKYRIYRNTSHREKIYCERAGTNWYWKIRLVWKILRFTTPRETRHTRDRNRLHAGLERVQHKYLWMNTIASAYLLWMNTPMWVRSTVTRPRGELCEQVDHGSPKY